MVRTDFTKFNARKLLYSLYDEIVYIPNEDDFNKPLKKEYSYFFFEGSSIIINKFYLKSPKFISRFVTIIQSLDHSCYSTIYSNIHIFEKLGNINSEIDTFNYYEKKLFCLFLMAFNRTMIFRDKNDIYYIPSFNRLKDLKDYSFKKN